MKKKAEATRTLAARFPLSTIKRTHHAAIEEDVSMQEFLRRAVIEYIVKIEAKHKRH